MATLDSIYEDAQRLSAPDRERLLQRLIEDLDPPEEGLDDEAWAREIERRLADLDAGRARLIDGKKAMSDLREELARRRRG